MCVIALDTDADPVYFAGLGPLGLALGFNLGSNNRLTAAGERAVMRAIADLTEAGLITVDQSRPRSHKRRYLIRLPGP